jgi:hypothetical protein
VNPDQTRRDRPGHRARHAAPRHPALRRFATGAAVVATGAVPLAAASGAQAAAARPSAAVPGAAALASRLPLGLAGPADALERPLAVDRRAVPGAADTLASGTRRLAAGLDRALPVPGTLAADLPRAAAAQLTPHLLQQGTLGTVARGVAPRAQALTGGLANGTGPEVGQLRSAGVPTVAEVTGSLGRTPLPAVGDVGQLTQSLPVQTMLSPDDPLTAPLNNLARL